MLPKNLRKRARSKKIKSCHRDREKVKVRSWFWPWPSKSSLPIPLKSEPWSVKVSWFLSGCLDLGRKVKSDHTPKNCHDRDKGELLTFCDFLKALAFQISRSRRNFLDRGTFLFFRSDPFKFLATDFYLFLDRVFLINLNPSLFKIKNQSQNQYTFYFLSWSKNQEKPLDHFFIKILDNHPLFTL